MSSYTINDGNNGQNYAVLATLATGTITPASLTISATPNTKVDDKSTTAKALPTVTGLLGTDSVTGLAETYTSPKPMGTNGSTLVVTAYKINDANNGNNYIVTLKSAKGTITRR